MKICVVGHGPSLKGAKRGTEIDSFDKVVRLKGSACVIRSEDYGSKVDAICASTDRKSTRLNSSHSQISYAVFCLKKKQIKPAYFWTPRNLQYRISSFSLTLPH